MIERPARLFLGFLCLLVAACTPDPQTAVLWEGYGFSWEHLSHRIAYLRAGAVPGEEEGSVEAQLGIIGGPFSTGEVLVDQPSYTLRWRELQSSYIRVSYLEWAMTVPPEGRQQEEVSLTFEELGLTGRGTHAVALQGVDWDSAIPQADDFPDVYDAASGWTPQGFGAGIELLDRTEEGLDLRLWSHFKAGPLDREDMNTAVPFARVGAVLRYAVIEADLRADPVLSDGALSAEAYYAVDPPNTPHDPIDETLRTLVVEGEPGLSAGIPLFRSWDFELNRSLDEEGRYLRAFSAGIEHFEYEAPEGRAEVLLDAFVSISSLFEEGDLEVEFSAEVDLLQWEETEAVVSPGLLEGTSDTLGVFDQVVPAP